MIETYTILSVLLDYPRHLIGKEEETEILTILHREQVMSAPQQKRLHDFLTYTRSFNRLEDWQAHYVELFDVSTKTNLYLFDLVYGSSRERGQAMVDLRESYARAGLSQTDNELPDYLPLFLEFVACQPTIDDARRLLAEVNGVLGKMAERFEKAEQPYLPLIEILAQLSASQK